MSLSNAATTSALCPTCGVHMTLAAIIPHAMDSRMARYTYVCAGCNRTRTYMLPSEAAHSVAAPLAVPN